MYLRNHNHLFDRNFLVVVFVLFTITGFINMLSIINLICCILVRVVILILFFYFKFSWASIGFIGKYPTQWLAWRYILQIFFELTYTMDFSWYCDFWKNPFQIFQWIWNFQSRQWSFGFLIFHLMIFISFCFSFLNGDFSIGGEELKILFTYNYSPI